MPTFPLKIAAVVTGLVLLAPAPAHAVVDPSKAAVLESVQKMDPLMMATCTTGTVADPAGAVAVPVEVPLVGCLSV
ncbi:hypothetical protein [Nonomuraea monospora]|uniref:hypothetical protein n=1 Tax=Nonomuraea monospora TaxID=568818 RepID=UPI0031DE313C